MNRALTQARGGWGQGEGAHPDHPKTVSPIPKSPNTDSVSQKVLVYNTSIVQYFFQ